MDDDVDRGSPFTRDLDLELILPRGARDDLQLKAIRTKVTGQKTGHIWEQFVLPSYVEGGLLSLGNVGPISVRRQIVCMHDANTRVFPQSYSRSYRASYRVLQPLLGRIVARVATVSHSSAEQLVHHGLCGRRKIVVIPNGHEHALRWHPQHSTLTRAAAGQDTIVVIGTPAPHKNIRLIIDMADRLAEAGLRVAIVGNTDPRVFQSKEQPTSANAISPPSDGGRPENGLTGTLFQVDSFRGDAITIPFTLSRLWFWRNTAVASLPPGPPASLAPGMLGYEWDESPDNGFRPEGLIHLSATTLPVNTYLLDYGNAVGPATATHNLSLYRAPSGAIVFGAGTVFWAWGLDDNHDYVNDDPSPEPLTPVDPNVQQATVNLLADMGVQPGTLQAGLIPATQSADHTPPVSTITAPVPGASVVQQQLVTISGTASDTSGLVAAVEVSTDGGTTWHAAMGTTSWTYSWWPLLPGPYTIKSAAVDDSLNREIPGAGVTVTVTPAGTVSLFTPSDAPFAVLALDDNAVELGVKFQVNTGGTITGIRFYKDPENTGTHVGHLWSAAGQLLGTATFANETASGWQQSDLTPPTTLTAGAIYVASYHTSGFYSADTNYFRAARTCGAITALASGSSGGNGVYAYGASGAFPANSFLNSNYWVDVVFNRTGGAGNLPPTANNDSGFTTAQNTALSIPASALLANDTDPNGYPLSIMSVGNPTNGAVAYNPATLAVTFTPISGYTGSASFIYTITNGQGGTASANVSLTVGASTATQSLFSTGDTPATVTVNDPNAVELGVKFETTVAGHVAGARFYKGPQNTGPHAANLWDAAGTLLASATFTNETASGWQTVNFLQPVAVAANTIYIVSYHTNGFYSANSNYFATAHSSGALTAPASTPSGGNGVYAYGSAGSFPASTYNATNYWVDVIFQN